MKREDSIEKMAVAMFIKKHIETWKCFPEEMQSMEQLKEDWRNGYAITKFGKIEINKRSYLNQAEAALDALLGELPGLANTVEIAPVIWGGILSADTEITTRDNAKELYQQLLSMRTK